MWAHESESTLWATCMEWKTNRRACRNSTHGACSGLGPSILSKQFLECELLVSTTLAFAPLDILVSRKDIIKVLLEPEAMTHTLSEGALRHLLRLALL